MPSPLIEQYLELKSKHPDNILFFRLGDFYEMFFDDAIEISKALQLVLTKRTNKIDGSIPMCGIPYHASEGYLEKLINLGYQVAIAEQMEASTQGKDLVRREVVKVVTQSTLLLESANEQLHGSPHIASVYIHKNIGYIALLNPLTGKIVLTESQIHSLEEMLGRYQAQEVVSNKKIDTRLHVVEPPQYVYKNTKEYLEALRKEIKVYSLEVFNVPRGTFSELALVGMVWYLENLHAKERIVLVDIEVKNNEEMLMIDEYTKRNLEIFPYDETKKSLWDVVNRTITPMGKRQLQAWMVQPTRNYQILEARVSTIEWVKVHQVWKEWKESLQGMKDLERLIAKINYGSILPRQMLDLAHSLQRARNLIAEIQDRYSDVKELDKILSFNSIDKNIEAIVFDTISEHASNSFQDGKIIKKGFSDELDELRVIVSDGRDWLAKYQVSLKDELGIPSLKIGFNKVFGYYVEVSKSHRNKIPDKYVKKQTLVNAERFITEQLKEYELNVLTAQDRIFQLEKKYFDELCGKVVENTEYILNIAEVIAYVDVICSLAEISFSQNYVKPQYHQKEDLEILDGRHPVVETIIAKSEFISNSITFSKSHSSYILTGPNMGGKSTFIRQIALITYMSHVGMHVPATKAIIPSVDRIFSRVGASDNLTQGMSTFMVEMTEVAHILKNATSKSLIILDEVGRGTATSEGLAIAKSVVEFLHDSVQAKVIFATHFHELAELESKHQGVKNLCVVVEEYQEELTFHHKIVMGKAEKSYGIEIARLAGIQPSIIHSARQYLQQYQQKTPAQGKIFEAPPLTSYKKQENDIIQALKQINVNEMTPIQAMQELNRLIEKSNEKNT